MKTSETITKISAALTKAWANIGAAHKGSKNPYFSSSYADLGAVMEVCKEPLLEQGVIVLQPVGVDENGGYVETVLLHESGEWMSDRMRIVSAKPNDPQAYGSAITYARRYALQSFVFIPATDDDGEGAMDRSKGRAQDKPHKPAEQPVKESVQPNLSETKAKLLEAITGAGHTPEEFMEAMLYCKQLPEKAKGQPWHKMKDETAQKFLDNLDNTITSITEFKKNKPTE